MGERQRKDKTVSGRRKSHDDMLVIYSPTAGLGINIDLLQCCSCALSKFSSVCMHFFQVKYVHFPHFP